MILKCKMCGGELEIMEGGQLAVCIYCDSKQTIPKLDDERRLNMFEMANHHRRNSDYDKAMGLFEAVLNEDRTDAEAYWSIILCKYGVVYVEDPATRKRMLTCNRTLHRSIMVDEDYKATLQYAKSFSRELYVKEAEIIDDIQKRAMDISLREKPYDIFISYKESDNQGRRTYDSLFAQDIYQQLIQVGYKVFYSRVSLEDKTGLEYEPYIFAALNSSKVMLVVGTNSENINAPWVKNEWSRFLVMKSENPEKHIFPVFRDMKVEDLPAEFKFLQAQDMSKIGAMQDLLHGLEKVLKGSKQLEPANIQLQTGENVNIENLLKRIEVFLQEGDIKKAKEYCEKILDIKISEPRAYMAQLRLYLYTKNKAVLFDEKEVARTLENIGNNSYFRKAMNYAQGEYLEKLQALKVDNEAFCFEYVQDAVKDYEKFDYQKVYGLIVQFAGEWQKEDLEKIKECAEALKDKQDLVREIGAKIKEKTESIQEIEVKIEKLKEVQYVTNKEYEKTLQQIQQCKQKIKEYKKMSQKAILHKVCSVLLLISSLLSIWIFKEFVMVLLIWIGISLIWVIVVADAKTNYKSEIVKEKNTIKSEKEKVDIMMESIRSKVTREEQLQDEIKKLETEITKLEEELMMVRVKS